MKKLFIGLCSLLVSTASMAAGANKMTMVTYFPVKYVAYSQVDVTKQMDIGLTSACQMNLGCTTDEGFNTGKSLRVNNLLKIAGGKLELNDAPAIVGTTAIIGSGNGEADFDFETNLRVGNYKQGYTLQADNMYLSELNLFGYKFPACSGETMSWQKLKLKNKDEVYLVCGEAEQKPFHGCSACSSYDEDSTEYENCVLNNVTSCCYYADKIYTKRGQNAFELMKNTSCYTCERQNGTDNNGPLNTVYPNVSDLAYYTGANVIGTASERDLWIAGDGSNATGAQPLNCLTYIPNGQSNGFYPVANGPANVSWKPIEKVCPSDGTCGGAESCVQICQISQCYIWDQHNGIAQCNLRLVTRLCDLNCYKAGW
ncbi:hypothetical protein [Candidatus Avelusimicrobium sp.]|uniref:hypothetical protein n=1 Tax=Candidatus Avelusimicrobium sp. TaxID=3048833 RepID=UPI003D7D23E8